MYNQREWSCCMYKGISKILINMKDIIKMTFDDTVYELYQAGWITKDLYLKGGVSFDLVLMYRKGIVLITETKNNYYDNACNDTTVNEQINNYRDLIKTKNQYRDDYTEALLNIANDQLTILGRIKALLITLNN